MPQIFIMSKLLRTSTLDRLGELLVPIVEKELGIEGKNDTAYSSVKLAGTIGEADVQIEIRYTAGHDEYGWGRPFDPTMEEQALLTDAIEQVFKSSQYTLSVWCKPFYNSYFRMCKK